MQFRILHSVLATSLVAFIAMPAVTADAGAPATTHAAISQLPDEHDGSLRLLALFGPAVAISVLTILGLTITLRWRR